MRNFPNWFPGTDFKKTARQWGAELTDVIEKPYAFVKHQMAQGKHKTSFLSHLLEAGVPSPEEEFTHKWSSLSLYTAGADTVSSVDPTYPPPLSFPASPLARSFVSPY